MFDTYHINNKVFFNSTSYRIRSISDDKSVSLSAASSLCLKILIERQGEVVTKAELLEKVWHSRGMNVSSNTLHQNIYLLRKSMDSVDKETVSVIKTIPRRGFLIPDDVRIEPISPPPPLLHDESVCTSPTQVSLYQECHTTAEMRSPALSEVKTSWMMIALLTIFFIIHTSFYKADIKYSDTSFKITDRLSVNKEKLENKLFYENQVSSDLINKNMHSLIRIHNLALKENTP